MELEKIKQEVVDYFQSESWLTLIKLLKRDHHETIYHAHIFVDTSLHPYTFRKILFKYFDLIDMPVDRPIDFQMASVGNIMAHNIHPAGTFHFDLAFQYNSEVVLSPMPKGSSFRGDNIQYWGEKETWDFINQYTFRPESKTDEDAVFDYFWSSDYRVSSLWSEYKNFVLDRRMVHFHANIETSLHPDIIEKVTLKIIEKEGWKIQLTVPCIFYPSADRAYAKICFLMTDPMFNFDIAWEFNPDVVIRPSTKFFIQNIRPDFDLRYEEKEDELMATGDFMPELTKDELKEVEAALKKSV
ncbi:hypothetical protein ACFLZL_04245 [Thermodesulfobacteriota bacterium]